MKKNRGLIFGVVALAMLCLIYVGMNRYMSHSQEKKNQQAEAEKNYLTDISSVKTLAYDYDGTELVFVKNGDIWNYEKDSEFPVLQSRVSSMADTAGKLEALRELTDGDDLSAYGLDKPVRKVTVTADDGKAETILIGSVTADGDYYAMLEDRDTAYLISSALFDETAYGLDDLMALEEFPTIAGTDIKSITINKGGVKEYYVKKTVDEENKTIAWYRNSSDNEENKLSYNSALNVLADSLAGLRVASCVNYKVTDEELADYGLSVPEVILSYTYDKDGTEESFTLSVGNLSEDGTGYLTKTDGLKNVNVIEKASVDKCLTVDGAN